MSKKIAGTAILITLITLLSKFVGFLRDVVLAATYGTTMNSDAFLLAQSIIGVITNLALAALGTTFIPIMSDYILHKSKAETNKFINVVYTFTIGLSIVICVLGFIFTDQLVWLFAPNLSSEASSLTAELTRIMLPIIVLTAIVTLSNAKLQNHGSYLAPAAIGFPLNFVLIFAMLFITDHFGVQGLAAALVVATFAQILLLLPFTRKLGYRFKIDFDFKEEGFRRIGILIVPIMIGSGIQQINTLVDRILASGLGEGSIAALNFSNRLSVFIIGLLSAAVVSIYYTSMSNYFSAGQNELFKKLLRNTVNVSILIIVPASVGFIVLRLPIVQLVFERGMFDRAASEMTAVALQYFTIGLIGFLLRDVLSRAFYALKDTRTAMINGSIAIGLNIILSIILVRFMGLGGLALGTSISGIVGSILLMNSLYKKIGDYGIRNICITLLKVLASSLVMGIVVHYCYQMVHSKSNINFLAVFTSVIVGVIVYGFGIVMARIDEVMSLKQAVFVRLKALRER
jgi:putative peptidoglycan lipid II flippase